MNALGAVGLLMGWIVLVGVTGYIWGATTTIGRNDHDRH